MKKSSIQNSILLMCFLFSGCASTTDIGQGLQVGAMGSNAGPIAPVLWTTGLIMEKVGGRSGQRELERDSEEYKLRKAVLYKRITKLESYQINKNLLKPSADTTEEQVKRTADLTCTKLDKIIETKGSMELHRSFLRKMIVPDIFMPEGNDEVVMYPLTENPFDSRENCLKEITLAGNRLVVLEKARKIKTTP